MDLRATDVFECGHRKPNIYPQQERKFRTRDPVRFMADEAWRQRVLAGQAPESRRRIPRRGKCDDCKYADNILRLCLVGCAILFLILGRWLVVPAFLMFLAGTYYPEYGLLCCAAQAVWIVFVVWYAGDDWIDGLINHD